MLQCGVSKGVVSLLICKLGLIVNVDGIVLQTLWDWKVLSPAKHLFPDLVLVCLWWVQFLCECLALLDFSMQKPCKVLYLEGPISLKEVDRVLKLGEGSRLVNHDIKTVPNQIYVGLVVASLTLDLGHLIGYCAVGDLHIIMLVRPLCALSHD